MPAGFDPTRAPAGRLARLGIVLDVTRTSPDPRQLAILADRAGIDVVWLVAGSADAPDPSVQPWHVLPGFAASIRRAAIGLLVDATSVSASAVSEALRRHEENGGGRVELCFVPPSATPADAETFRWLRAAGGPAGVSGFRRLSAAARDATQIAHLFPVVDDIVLPAWSFPDLETIADETRAEAAEAGRDPATLGVAALVHVSIGRTQAEAAARIGMDPGFHELGHPSETGIFGTLEECQDRVIALAHAGVSDLRCVIPSTPDAIDVMAQLTAMTVGTTDVLVPGSLRSPPPPPPVGWGGRPDRPPQARVSGGSRRR